MEKCIFKERKNRQTMDAERETMSENLIYTLLFSVLSDAFETLLTIIIIVSCVSFYFFFFDFILGLKIAFYPKFGEWFGCMFLMGFDSPLQNNRLNINAL